MATFKRQTHGIRMNLTAVEEEIAYLQRDIANIRDPRELGYLQRKLKQLEKMRADAIRHGYGYREYTVKRSLGQTLMIAVITLLTALLLVGYLMVILN